MRLTASSFFCVALLIAIFGIISLYFQVRILDVHSIVLAPGKIDLTHFIREENQQEPRQQQHPASSKIKIAYAVSLIHCHKSDLTIGFIDSAAVLRHSVHRHSVHYQQPPANKALSASRRNISNDNASYPRYGPPGKYSYQMVAIVHAQCAQHGPALERLGYQVLIRDNPLPLDQVKGDWYRTHVEGENCCGFDEFIKLYAYTLTEYPIVVHLDMDVILLQPLDVLFDAMLMPPTSAGGKAARHHIQAHELEYKTDQLPEGPIEAFFTRDMTSSYPWERSKPFQGGFLVIRPDPHVFQSYVEIIRQGNYTRGRGVGKGWANTGHAGYQGALAIQGIVAYFYDFIRPGTFVELNVCRWNQVVADVIWRGPDAMEYNGMCRRFPRSGPGTVEIGGVDCEDCRILPPNQVKTMHYTACKKPWECWVPHPRNPADKRQVYRLSQLTNITTCMLMHREWFRLRRNLEDNILAYLLSKNNTVHKQNIMPPRDGKYEKDFFLGYCRASWSYIPMIIPESLNLEEIYK